MKRKFNEKNKLPVSKKSKLEIKNTPYLFCFDFDGTVVKGHYHNEMVKEEFSAFFDTNKITSVNNFFIKNKL